MTNIGQLLKREDLIRCEAMKRELGYKTSRFWIESEEEALDWLRSSHKNSLIFTHGELFGDQLEWETMEITASEL